MEKTMHTLFSRLSIMEKKGQIIDFKQWMRYFAWDLSGELAYGKSFQYLDAWGKDESGYISLIDEGRLVSVFVCKF